ncbi:MAG: hypothetical protein N2376_02455 [Clostridia bacterium]|nr:hypothetical protein [Clostridia bacterium]
MAESFIKGGQQGKQGENRALNDDILRQALKSGLTSINASDELVKRTLNRCKEEIDAVSLNQSSRKFSYSWVYKLGAPIAACALVVVLAFGSGNLFTARQKTSNLAMPSASESASPSASALLDSNSAMKANEAGADGVSAQQNEITPMAKFEKPVSSDSASRSVGNQDSNGFAGEASQKRLAPAITSLNSLPGSTFDIDATESVPTAAFDGIVAAYNQANALNLMLDKGQVTLVNALAPSGAAKSTFQNAKNTDVILSGNRYWMLPLKNQNGAVEAVLAVNTYNDNDPAQPISSNEILYKNGEEGYKANALGAGPSVYQTLPEVFDTASLKALFEASGYSNISDLVIVDINYGMDFMAFAKSDGKELGMPLLTSGNFLGLENRKVYLRDELFKFIVQALAP